MNLGQCAFSISCSQYIIACVRAFHMHMVDQKLVASSCLCEVCMFFLSRQVLGRKNQNNGASKVEVMLLYVFWIQIFPSGCGWESAAESGGNFSKQLHGLSGPH